MHPGLLMLQQEGGRRKPWKCESCDFTNSIRFDKCSLCEEPRHTQQHVNEEDYALANQEEVIGAAPAPAPARKRKRKADVFSEREEGFFRKSRSYHHSYVSCHEQENNTSAEDIVDLTLGDDGVDDGNNDNDDNSIKGKTYGIANEQKSPVAGPRLSAVMISPAQSPLKGIPKEIISDVQEEDVLLGRGGRATNWPGNVKFRSIIGQFFGQWKMTTRKGKRPVAKLVYQIITMKHGSRFVEECHQRSGQYIQICQNKALDKIAQAFRDADNKGLMSVSMYQGGGDEPYGHYCQQQQSACHSTITNRGMMEGEVTGPQGDEMSRHPPPPIPLKPLEAGRLSYKEAQHQQQHIMPHQPAFVIPCNPNLGGNEAKTRQQHCINDASINDATSTDNRQKSPLVKDNHNNEESCIFIC